MFYRLWTTKRLKCGMKYEAAVTGQRLHLYASEITCKHGSVFCGCGSALTYTL